MLDQCGKTDHRSSRLIMKYFKFANSKIILICKNIPVSGIAGLV